MGKIIVFTGTANSCYQEVADAYRKKNGGTLISLSSLEDIASTAKQIKNSPTDRKEILCLTPEHAIAAHDCFQKELDFELTYVALDTQMENEFFELSSSFSAHPYQKSGLELIEAVEKERDEMEKIRGFAKPFIDVTGLSKKEETEMVLGTIAAREAGSIFVYFSSFGYKYGNPKNADMVFDCRNVANPFWVESLRKKTGLDKDVAAYIEQDSATIDTYNSIAMYLNFFLERTKRKGRTHAFIYFGCTGGQHRSVYFANRLYENFKTSYPCMIDHREMKRYKGKGK